MIQQSWLLVARDRSMNAVITNIKVFIIGWLNFLKSCEFFMKKKNFMAPFYGWGSTASRLEPLRGGSLLCTTKFPEIRSTHFIYLGRMKGWVDLGAAHWKIHFRSIWNWCSARRCHIYKILFNCDMHLFKMLVFIIRVTWILLLEEVCEVTILVKILQSCRCNIFGINYRCFIKMPLGKSNE